MLNLTSAEVLFWLINPKRCFKLCYGCSYADRTVSLNGPSYHCSKRLHSHHTTVCFFRFTSAKMSHKQIYYSEKYDDDKYEYRWVHFPHSLKSSYVFGCLMPTPGLSSDYSHSSNHSSVDYYDHFFLSKSYLICPCTQLCAMCLIGLMSMSIGSVLQCVAYRLLPDSGISFGINKGTNCTLLVCSLLWFF